MKGPSGAESPGRETLRGRKELEDVGTQTQSSSLVFLLMQPLTIIQIFSVTQTVKAQYQFLQSKH